MALNAGRLMPITNPKAAANLSWRDVAIGLALAALVIGSAVGLHVYAVFFADWTAPGMVLLAVPIVLLQAWLFVGLFIVAHDSMHGSLAPRAPWLNEWIGRLCVTLYAGFSYDKLYESHHRHHRYSGTPDDPDFDPGSPRSFWPWFFTFFRRYFGLRELIVLTIVVAIYALILGDRYPYLLVFWAVPSIASALQLFYFGTYRPHRLEEEPFTDRHNTRSNEFGYFLSLMTCFHFGYHHEHHEKPWVPWWKLPSYRDSLTAAAST